MKMLMQATSMIHSQIACAEACPKRSTTTDLWCPEYLLGTRPELPPWRLAPEICPGFGGVVCHDSCMQVNAKYCLVTNRDRVRDMLVNV